MSLFCCFKPLPSLNSSTAHPSSCVHTLTHTYTHIYTHTHTHTRTRWVGKKVTKTVQACSLSFSFFLFLFVLFQENRFAQIGLLIFLRQFHGILDFLRKLMIPWITYISYFNWRVTCRKKNFGHKWYSIGNLKC